MVMGQMRSKKLHGTIATNHKQTAEEILSKYVDLSTFTSLVMAGVTDCEKYVDVSSYNISVSALDIITDYFFYGVPEAFNVRQMGCSYYESDNTIVKIVIEYNSFADTASEYDSCIDKISSAADKLLNGIKGNNALDAEQKLLLLHDRLALWNTYGYPQNTTTIEAHTAFGALGNKMSVCQGYAMAYMYLLNQVGIESYYCSSEALNHGWNIVLLNDKKYHVDITWDDWDLNRRVGHENFLRSSNGIYSTGHEATDYDTSPTDTKYDNYFWHDYDAEFQLVNNELYYVDYENEAIKRYNDKQTVCSVKAIWPSGNSSYWMGNFSCIASDGKSIFYSQPDAIYRFDLTTQKSEKIYAPNLDANESIYSFDYQDSTIVCFVGFAPYSSDYRTIKQPYEYDYNNGDEEKHCAGDSNNDGAIDNKDYAILMQYLNGWNVNIVEDSSDVNDDGSIDNKDYALLMQYLNGWDVILK